MAEYDTQAVLEVRKASRHFAMLYFHFCKTLVSKFGEEEALDTVTRSLFDLAVDRTDPIRERALKEGLDLGAEKFREINDIAYLGWKGWNKEMGGVRCPYAETWLGYFEENPWFKPFATLYCNVIDTTSIENYSRSLSHRLLKNLLWGDESCEREYYPSEAVQNGKFTYENKAAD
jgi:hypothetical protein